MGEETLDPALSGYNYVITAHKPTSVTQSVVGSFTGSSDVNLIIAYV
jgi:DNA damage-binding protein 1